MIDEKQRRNLSSQLVRLTNEKIDLKGKKKAFLNSTNDFIKQADRKIDALAKAIETGNEEHLFGVWDEDQVERMLEEAKSVEIKRK